MSSAAAAAQQAPSSSSSQATVLLASTVANGTSKETKALSKKRLLKSAGNKSLILSDFDARRRCLRCNSCPGFVPHEWRKSCVVCRCPRGAHPDGEEGLGGVDDDGAFAGTFGFERLGLEVAVGGIYATNGMTGNGTMVAEGYSWSPPVS